MVTNFIRRIQLQAMLSHQLKVADQAEALLAFQILSLTMQRDDARARAEVLRRELASLDQPTLRSE